MAVYYIDNKLGKAENDGLSAEFPKSDYRTLSINAGDSVLFKRGSFIRGWLDTTGGEVGAPVTYGAYGEGDAPVFCGSLNVSGESNWREISKNVWECIPVTDGDVGNIVFDCGKSYGTLRWNKEDLAEQGDFWDSRFSAREDKDPGRAQQLLVYSVGNPGLVYEDVEAVSYANRCMGRLQSNMVIENLRIINSGVHGFAGAGENITIRNCVFENIGGCVWSRKLEIRFGNAIELWIHAINVTVEGCSFKSVYDSCVTHQGPGDQTVPADRFICKNNIFDTYGMAAFEYRDMMTRNSVFEGNICKNAGCGFAMQGEVLPRKSEIWPQPMGHHIFLWRIPRATEGGELKIINNEFGPAPVGAAIYSIISPEAEAQMVINNNKYTENEILLIRFGGVNYSSLEEYSQASGNDKESAYIL